LTEKNLVVNFNFLSKTFKRLLFTYQN